MDDCETPLPNGLEIGVVDGPCKKQIPRVVILRLKRHQLCQGALNVAGLKECVLLRRPPVPEGEDQAKDDSGYGDHNYPGHHSAQDLTFRFGRLFFFLRCALVLMGIVSVLVPLRRESLRQQTRGRVEVDGLHEDAFLSVGQVRLATA